MPARPRALLLAGLLLLAAGPARPEGAATGADAVERLGARLAEALAAGLAPGPPAGPPRLVLWLPADERLAVERAEAERLARTVEAGFLAEARGRWRLLARDPLRARLEAGDDRRLARHNPVAALAGPPPAAEIAAVLDVELLPEGFALALTALSVPAGEVLAQLATPPLPLAPGMRVEAGRLRPLEAALEEAAAFFCAEARAMRALGSCGLGFERSGAGAPFGRWVEERLLDALRDACREPQLERRLALRREPAACAGLRALDPPEAERPWLLTGSWWDLGQAVELRLVLRDPWGQEIGRSFKVAPATVPATLPIRPSHGLAHLVEGERQGPIGLALESGRGSPGRYRLGEELELLVRIDRPAFLSCFYRQSDGATYRLLPNPLWPEPRPAPGRTVRIPERGGPGPGGGRRPFALRFGPPEGVELVKCFATPDDPGDRLPPGLGRPAAGPPRDGAWRDGEPVPLAPLPPELADRFHLAFRAAFPRELTEAHLVLDVRAR